MYERKQRKQWEREKREDENGGVFISNPTVKKKKQKGKKEL